MQSETIINIASKISQWLSPRPRKQIVAGMATMPTRSRSFPIAFNSIIKQVDRLYLYLDGHIEVPEAARNHPRVVPIFASEAPGLASDGKFIGVYREAAPVLYVSVDDDIEYPSTYVATLRRALEQHSGRAVVGYHGSVLHQPFRSYVKDRTVYFFGAALDELKAVDVLGTGTVMFDTEHMSLDIHNWSRNRNDLHLASTAKFMRLPLLCLPREANFLRPIETEQPDSIFHNLKRDDRIETVLAIELKRTQMGYRRPVEGPEVYASHGVAEGCRDDQFQHKNLIDLRRFSEFLQSTEKFVPLKEALNGRGKALTIDDATEASAQAARLARAYGHSVTLFINPWQIESGLPYPASRMDGLLDRIDVGKFMFYGREFNLRSFEGKLEFRMFYKDLTRAHTDTEQTLALIGEIETMLGVHWKDIPKHMKCIDLEAIHELRGAAVEIENHYWTHLDPAAHNEKRFTEEFLKAKKWLLDRLGIVSMHFASPFGEFLPPTRVLSENGTTCLLLHNDLSPGLVEPSIINRITLSP